MTKPLIQNTFFVALILGALFSYKVKEVDTTSSENELDTKNSIQLVVNFKDTGIKIQPTMYGIFFEDINFAADGGLYAEMVKNRSFEFTIPKMGWLEPNSNNHSLNKESGFLSPIKYPGKTTNHTFARVEIKGSKYELINEGFRGMGIKKDDLYNLSLNAKKISGNITKIKFKFIDENGLACGEVSIAPNSNHWSTYEAQLTASKTVMKAKLKITFEGTGKIDLDMISLFPVDTWKGRNKGLRKDIVELLDAIHPGFIRFPGGCIVEGRTLERRYQWKKTVGNIDERELLINRWNTEFAHKPAPDYFQSFGMGFFEYFQLSEDLDAEPLPVLSCGMACQYNTGELAPMEELDPYVQDALDLIEFANGNISTKWGKLRAEMGHPEPFNLKYIGIGNEQWGPDYMDRYKVFDQAIKSKYPDIIIVSGSGPSPDGEYFDYGWEELKKMNAQIIDEHYYRSPQWFLENAGRYDSYDRNGPKVFAGEYAAHPKGIEDGPNENNWEAALSEAAFMTGLERNADVVHLTSYAPLLAHIDAFQWAPELIWFNNLESYGTANYQVQKLYGNNPGTDLLTITENGKPLTGQHNLFASVVKDSKTNEIIIKLVNTSNNTQNVTIDLSEKKLKSNGTKTTLTSDNLVDENSFTAPNKIIPKESVFKLNRGKALLDLDPSSFTILKLSL